jgi:hypothetical protein
MGYTTDFEGQIKITPALSPELVKYINDFGNTRRMKRNVSLLTRMYAGGRGFNGKYGKEGEYFVSDGGNFGQDDITGVIDLNAPPSTQPGLWCQWHITEDGKYIEWDGSEKFYESADWMKYIINNFIGDNHKCNGVIHAFGEDRSDVWNLIVANNNVTVEFL